MKLLVLAANGQIAQIVTNRILTEPTFKAVELTLVLRQAKRLKRLVDNPRVTLVEGALTDAALINRVMVGQDLVYIAVVDHGATNQMTTNVIQAMQTNGVQRVISTNILGIYNEVPGKFGRWNLAMVESGLQAAIQADQLLAQSGLNNTTLRLPWLNDRNEIKYSVTTRNEPFVGVSGSRQSVADLVLKIVANPDVMATGYHAAVTAEVKAGDTVVVLGDGAVGLCGVIAAKLLGAKRIIAMSRHADRQALAREFGATDIVAERGAEAVQRVLELTDQAGADAILECVGTEQSVATAVQVGRPGALVGRVGVPQKADMNTNELFWRNIGLRGGIASVTTYDKAVLLEAVLSGQINPGKVFTQRFELADVQKAYQAMDQRTAIKSLLVVAEG